MIVATSSVTVLIHASNNWGDLGYYEQALSA